MKKLLFSLMIAGVSAVTFNAQAVKTWDFGDDQKWGTGPNVTDPNYQTINYSHNYDGLVFMNAANPFGGFNTNSLTAIGDYTPKLRLAFGGNSYGGSNNPALNTTGAAALPTRRYIEIAVAGNSKIAVWGRGGGARSIVLVNKGTSTVIGVGNFSSNTDAQKFEFTYTGASNTLIIASGAGDNSLYKIEYTDNSTLAVNDVKFGVKANAFSSGNKIYVSNLESKNTNISVYNANGSLVKSLKSSVDTNFEISTKGLYIVNIKSEAGEKSVKVLVK